jgi:osmotically-inducible protein OsmY
MNAAMSSANALYDHRSVQNNIQNHYQQVAVYNAIKQDPKIKQPTDIGVSAINNTILLTGQTPDFASRQEAGLDAKMTPDVTTVLNFIDISPPVSEGTKLADSWITTKIKTKFVTSNDVSPDSIKIITDDGVVYLMGSVPRLEANAAINIARDTDGVKKVVTVIYFLDPSTS